MEVKVRRLYALFAAMGLLIVGLLVGILFTLLLNHPPEMRPAAPPLAEQVRLGAPVPVRAETTKRPVEGAVPGPQALSDAFREVARRVTPAVVFIQVESPNEIKPGEWFHNFDEQGRERLFDNQPPRQSVGSGVVIRPDGYIVTNNHVVEGASTIMVTFTDKRQYEGHIVGIDPATDLAVIRIPDAENLETITLGDSDSLMVGDWALAVGNPFRLTSTVTAGIVSALGRQVNIITDSFGIEDFIQTDAAINPGNSGGALVNTRGELIGISTAIATESGSYEGYGFAVPVNLMARVAKDLIAYGEVHRGFLGVTIQEVTSTEARRLGLAHVGGVYLESVRPEGAADRAGLRGGDVILSVGSTPVNAPNELQRRIALYRPGERLLVEVWRSGGSRRLEIELLGKDDPSYEGWLAADSPTEMTNPHAAPMPVPNEEVLHLESWGLGVRALTPREQQAFGTRGGAFIAYVRKSSPSDAGGLPSGAILNAVDDVPVLSPYEAVDAFAEVEGDPVLLRVVRRDGTTGFYEIESSAAGR